MEPKMSSTWNQTGFSFGTLCSEFRKSLEIPLFRGRSASLMNYIQWLRHNSEAKTTKTTMKTDGCTYHCQVLKHSAVYPSLVKLILVLR
jgi:hypothetical protein